MAPKEPQGTSASAKDIDSLFSRAGLIGARYRAFPRAEPSRPTGGVAAPPSPATEASPSVPAAEARPLPPSPSSTLPYATNPKAAHGVAPWSSLERIFADKPLEVAPSQPSHSGVTVAILSLAGGVGKTTLAVTLARALSGMQKQVLIAEGGLVPAVPHHFGSRGQKLGPLQFFYAPAGAAALPIGMFRLATTELQNRDFQELVEQVESSDSLLLIDFPTLQSTGATEVLAYVDHVLVPVTPDVHSISGLGQLKLLFSAAAAAGYSAQVHYVINRMDESRPLHHEVKARLEEMLGEQLMPFVVHEDQAFAEASANGVTIVDYRPGSAAAKELGAIAEWFSQLAQPLPAASPKAAVR